MVPERIVKPDGPVYQEFCSAFTSPRIGQILFGLIANQLDSTPTLKYEAEATAALREEARNQRPRPFRHLYAAARCWSKQGQTIGEEQLILLRLEHDAAVAELGFGDRVRRIVGIFALVAALYFLAGSYVYRRERRFVRDPGRVAMICGLVILALAVVRILAAQTWNAEVVPVAIAGMIVAIAYNQSFAMMVTFGLSILTTIALGTEMPHFLVVMGGTAAGVLTLGRGAHPHQADQGRRHRRGDLFPHDLGDRPLAGRNRSSWSATTASGGAGWGLMAGFFLGGSLPFHRKRPGNRHRNQPARAGRQHSSRCFQELVRRAPGTHNHSITVGAIAESAAERIGADALLVRIGAYFHDIGKMLKPHYFVENQVGPTSRHAKLAPAMSTLIIIGHVKDGVDLGRQHHLPEPIIDLIEQHHGTTLVEYFYHEANRRNGTIPTLRRSREMLIAIRDRSRRPRRRRS